MVNTNAIEVVEGEIVVPYGSNLYYTIIYNIEKGNIAIYLRDKRLDECKSEHEITVWIPPEYEMIIENSWIGFKDHKLINNVTTLFSVFKNYFEKHEDFINIKFKDNTPKDSVFQIIVSIDLKYISDEITLDVPYVQETYTTVSCYIGEPYAKDTPMIEEFRQIKMQVEELQKKCEKMTPMIEAFEQTRIQFETMQKKFEILIKLNEDISNQIKLIK